MAGALAVEPGDLEDDLPDLVNDSGDEGTGGAGAAEREASPQVVGAGPVEASERPGRHDNEPVAAENCATGISEADGFLATAALRAAALAAEAKAKEAAGTADGENLSAVAALRGLLEETAEKPREPQEVSDTTIRMIHAVTKDDFEECEDAIMQRADVNADCGAGMRPLHFTALRGEMFLTELLLAHGAEINIRDMSGNTPLLYACHFYRQHGKGVHLVAQLLHHRADPFYRVRDGKLAGKSAFDLMDKACNEPNTDENVPRQMRAMLKLAMESTDDARDAITKVWMSVKSQNKKLYQVSSKRDSFSYSFKNVDWEMPEDVKNAQASAPVLLDDHAETLREERFIELKDYLFGDEGDKVKVYITFPERASAALADKDALEVTFAMESLDVKLRGADESFRLRVEPLYGTIEVGESKHRISAGSRKVTLTLCKRHKSRIWPSIQKPR